MRDSVLGNVNNYLEMYLVHFNNLTSLWRWFHSFLVLWL